MQRSPLLWILSLALPPTSAPVDLRLDQPARGILSRAGPSPVFEFVPIQTGEVSISLTSCDFDARLVVSTASEWRAEIDGGGIGSDAWTLVPLQAQTRYRIAVEAQDAGDGAFEILVASEKVAPPDRDVERRAAITWSEQAARSALARGRRERAARLFLWHAELCSDNGPFASAESSYRTAITLAGEAEVDEVVRAARFGLARVERWLGRTQVAIEALEAQRAEPRTIADPEGSAWIALLLGDAYLAQENVPAARASYEQALEIARTAGRVVQVCLAQAGLSACWQALGDDESARQALQKAFDQIADCPEDVEANLRLHAARLFDRDSGEPTRASDELESALLLRTDGFVRVDLLGTLGSVKQAERRWSEARRAYEQSQELALRLGVAGHAAKYLLGFAALELEEGHGDLAVSMLERALELSAGEDGRRQRAEVLLTLGRARLARATDEDLSAASTGYREVESIGEALGDERLIILARLQLALFQASGPAKSARFASLDERALATDQVHVQALVRGFRAWDDYERGLDADAVRRALESADLFALTGDEENRLLALDTVLRAAGRQEDLATMTRAFAEASLVLEGDWLHAIATEERCARRALFGAFAGFAQDLAAARVAAPEGAGMSRETAIAQGFRQASLWKGRGLIETLVARRRAGHAEETNADVAALSAARSQERRQRLAFEAALHARCAQPEIDAALQAACAARAAREELEGRANERTLTASPALRVPTASSVRAALADERAALLEYAPGTDRLFVYVLTRKGLELVDLGERRPIETLVAGYIEALRGSGPADPPTVIEVARLGHALHEKLLAPALRAAGEETETLLVVPSAELAGLPFDALVASKPAQGLRRFGEVDFVVRKKSVAILPSASALVELSARRRRSDPARILLLAYPRYPPQPSALVTDADPARKSSAPGPEPALAALEYTKVEAAAVGRLLASWLPRERADRALAEIARVELAGDGSCGASSFDLALGASATRDRLFEDPGRYTIVHVAAHGFAYHEGPRDAALALAFTPKAEGWVGYGELLELRLGADLVVLAACETAVGRAVPGEGMRSLSTAFLHAGARSVIATLWSAGDMETDAMMRAFYEAHLQRDLPELAALRQVKLACLDGRERRGLSPRGQGPVGRFVEAADPYYWAAFTYLGPLR